MTELTLQPREQSFQPPGVDVTEVNSISRAFDRLRELPPGIALIDLDNTSRKPIQEAKKGMLGRVTPKVLDQVDELKDKGWRFAVVTNQPYTGRGKSHQVARAVSTFRGYEAFPACYERRDIDIFGGGWGFFVKHFKKSREAVRKLQNWVKKQGEELKGEEVELFMIGDRESDIKFINRLAKKLQGENFIRSIKMLKVPGSDKGLARFTP